jgi:hypothetical protein
MSGLVVQMTESQLKAMVEGAVREALGGAGGKSVKTTKAKKEVDPDAPKREPNEWIKFTQEVRAAISASIVGEKNEKGEQKKAHPKAVTQVASALKEKGLMGSATSEQIVAGYKAWIANPPEQSKADLGLAGKNKKAKAAEAASTSGSDGEKSPGGDGKKVRKPWSEETKAAAAAKRAATKASKEGAPSNAAASNAAASNAAGAPVPATAWASPGGKSAAVQEEAEDEEAEEEEEIDPVQDFAPFVFNKKSYVKNGRGDVLTEGAMEWVGRYDAVKKSIDKKVPKPEDLEC